MRADIERAARAERMATEFEWTWTTDDLQPFCDQVGWQLSGLDEQYPTATTDLEVNRPDAVLYVDDAPATELFRPIDQIWFRASDVVLDRDDLEQELDEVFDALVQRIFELIGQRPTGWWVEPTRGLSWEFPRLFLEATISAGSVYVSLVSPAYQRWSDEIERQAAEDA